MLAFGAGLAVLAVVALLLRTASGVVRTREEVARYLEDFLEGPGGARD
jgi:hypothetical protein